MIKPEATASINWQCRGDLASLRGWSFYVPASWQQARREWFAGQYRAHLQDSATAPRISFVPDVKKILTLDNNPTANLSIVRPREIRMSIPYDARVAHFIRQYWEYTGEDGQGFTIPCYGILYPGSQIQIIGPSEGALKLLVADQEKAQ